MDSLINGKFFYNGYQQYEAKTVRRPRSSQFNRHILFQAITQSSYSGCMNYRQSD